MVLRELRNNPVLSYQPIGFIDDDSLKSGKVIHGLKVYDSNGPLPELCEEKEIEEILISFRNIKPESLKRIREICRTQNVSLRRATLKIEPVVFD